MMQQCKWFHLLVCYQREKFAGNNIKRSQGRIIFLVLCLNTNKVCRLSKKQRPVIIISPESRTEDSHQCATGYNNTMSRTTDRIELY